MTIPGVARRAERIIFDSREGRGSRRLGLRAIGARRPASEGEIVAALQALGYSLAEAREASRAALATGVDSSLEERVKAALRSLLRD